MSAVLLAVTGINWTDEMNEIEKLKAYVSVLKSAPMFGKAAAAEKTIDILVDIVADMEKRLALLEGVKHGQS